MIVLPSTSEPTLGSGKWSAGPTIVALKQEGAWTIGALWNQVWSFSGETSRADVSQMFLQPFLSYQATYTLTVTLQSESTANWNATDQKWTVPINFLVAKLSSFGTFRRAISSGSECFPSIPTSDRRGRSGARSSFCCRGSPRERRADYKDRKFFSVATVGS